jgi:hypothetical protein
MSLSGLDAISSKQKISPFHCLEKKANQIFFKATVLQNSDFCICVISPTSKFFCTKLVSNERNILLFELAETSAEWQGGFHFQSRQQF